MRILFLYTELAGYFISCIHELSNHAESIHIIRWPVNSEAPFEFAFPENVKVYNRKDFDTNQLYSLTQILAPNLIISSGWMDKGYLRVCRKFKNKIPTIMGMDNQWHGTLKQRLMCLIAPFILHSIYSHVWVPGPPQKEYAKKLGYPEENISEGFYSADVPLFESEANNRTTPKKYPKRFIYVGRYIHAKGLDLLFKAFADVSNEKEHDWELWCFGTGELYEKRTLHPKIKHFGFLQPAQLKEQLRMGGVFVLPSRFEPWGVVVHEMAAAGFPLVLSSAIGSASTFLEENKNGFIFQNENPESLKKSLLKIINSSDDELKKMAKTSHLKGISYTPSSWVDNLKQFIK